jgi:hypothetical protein
MIFGCENTTLLLHQPIPALSLSVTFFCKVQKMDTSTATQKKFSEPHNLTKKYSNFFGGFKNIFVTDILTNLGDLHLPSFVLAQPRPNILGAVRRKNLIFFFRW